MNDIAAFLDDDHAARVEELLEDHSDGQPIEVGITGFEPEAAWERWQYKRSIAPDMVGVDIAPAIEELVDAYASIAGSSPADHPMARTIESIYEDRGITDTAYDIDLQDEIMEREGLVAGDARQLEDAVGSRSTDLLMAFGLFGQLRDATGDETYDDPIEAYDDSVNEVLDSAHEVLDPGGTLVIANEYDLQPATHSDARYGPDHFQDEISERFKIEQTYHGDIYTIHATRPG